MFNFTSFLDNNGYSYEISVTDFHEVVLNDKFLNFEAIKEAEDSMDFCGIGVKSGRLFVRFLES